MKVNDVRTMMNDKSHIILMKGSSRVIVLRSSTKPKEITERNEIVELILDDYSVKVGENVTVHKQKFKVNKIRKGFKYSDGRFEYNLHSSIITKSSYFLMPMLGGTRSDFLWNTNFVNCFYKRENSDKEMLYVLYRFSGDKLFLDFEEDIKSHPFYISSEEVDKYQTLITFEIEDKEIFQIFKNGKYSHFPQKYKDAILEFHPGNNAIKRILYKDKKLKEVIEKKVGCRIPSSNEYHDIQHEEDETFYNKYIID